MIWAIAGIDIPYCDENDDIVTIREALSFEKKPIEWDKNHIWVGDSGTATRFSIAYYATQECQVIIDGSEQMQKRPISSIIEAVKSLGAEVIGESLPITIKGCRELKKSVEVDSSQSSQTISALMLIGMKHGLKITTRGKRNSWSYVELTAEVMRQFGIKVEIEERNNYAEITIHPIKDIRHIKTGNIEIKNLTFGYSPLAEPVIKDFNLSLEKGKTFYTSKEMVDVPIVGKVTAGLPILAVENIEDTFPFEAPIALNTPISFVLSYTEIYVIIPIIIDDTTKEIEINAINT